MQAPVAAMHRVWEAKVSAVGEVVPPRPIMEGKEPVVSPMGVEMGTVKALGVG